MSATLTAPPIEQVAPNLITRVKPGDLAKGQNLMLGIGAILLIASCALNMFGEHSDRFFFGYLVAYMFTLGICLGALFFTMVQHITRAGWSVSVRRVAENTMAALPWMLLLFLPIVVGFGHLFHHWSDPALVDPQSPKFDAVIAGKSGFLNPTFFFVRVLIYFAVWIGLATWFRRSSIAQDQTGDPAISLKMSRVAAPGLLLFALSITFAAFDWIMSLDPHWFSTIFGVTYFAGGFMAFLAFVTLLGMWLNKKGYLRDAINVEHYHDLGKLLFGFMVFWTYTNFSQYMLIWYANLPEETLWYQHRREHGWGTIGTLLIFGHFLVPFAFLMSRHIKRNRLTLAIGAAFLLVMHWLDMQYLILPNYGHAAEGSDVVHAVAEDRNLFGPIAHDLGEYWHGLHWYDFTTLIGILCLITGFVIMNIRKSNLVPLRDPRLAESVHFQNF